MHLSRLPPVVESEGRNGRLSRAVGRWAIEHLLTPGSLCCTSMHWSCQQRDVVQVNTAGVAATGGRAGFGGPLTDADAAGAPADGIAELTGVARTTARMDST